MERMTLALTLSPPQQGLLVSTRFVGGVVVGLALWAGHTRVLFRHVLAAALGLLTASAALLPVPTFGAALLISAFRGLSVGAIIPLSGMYAAAQRRWAAGSIASAVNASVSAGLVLVSAVAFTLSTRAGIPWQAYWVASSVVGMVLLVALPLVRFPTTEEGQDSPPVSGDGESTGVGAGEPAGRTDWSLAFAGLLVVGAESVLLGLLPAYSASEFSSVVAGGAPTVLGRISGYGGEIFALLLMSGILLGRSLGTVWFKVAETQVILPFAILSLTVAGALWSIVPGLSPIVIVLLGLATATMFPGLIAFVSEFSPRRATATIAAIGWTGGAGGTLVPMLAGAIISAGLSPRGASLFVFVPALGALSLVLLRARGRQKETGAS